ncbi:MAG TPA: SGNH/GDSL hydrolase family protein [Bryobacteraceae bacterium]|nr:SGNH/GDSL hydrolase family protein [Bryobacteraceae bacterium]
MAPFLHYPSAQTSAMRESKRTEVYLLRACFLLASLVLAVVLAEAVLRIVGPPDGRVHLEAFAQYDPLLGWKISPNVSTRIVTQDYTTNVQYGPKGLRGRDHPYEKPPGVSRILILGDSMVDGYSVPIEDRVSEVLEAKLGPEFDVVNLGVSGYSTDQEMLMLETEGWKYQPDLVVLFFYYNDVWMNGERLLAGDTFKPHFDLDPNGNLVLKGVPVPKPKPALEDRFKLYALLRDAIKKAPALYSLAKLGHAAPPPSLPMPAGAGGTADQFRVYQKQDSPELARVWNITRALLRRIDQETKQHGGSFLVFYAPSRVELSAEEWSQSRIPATYDSAMVVNKITQICRSEGIPLLEPSRAFREAREQGPLSYAHDVHWTPAGHRLAARLVADYVQNAWHAQHSSSASVAVR